MPIDNVKMVKIPVKKIESRINATICSYKQDFYFTIETEEFIIIQDHRFFIFHICFRNNSTSDIFIRPFSPNFIIIAFQDLIQAPPHLLHIQHRLVFTKKQTAAVMGTFEHEFIGKRIKIDFLN